MAQSPLAYAVLIVMVRRTMAVKKGTHLEATPQNTKQVWNFRLKVIDLKQYYDTVIVPATVIEKFKCIAFKESI